MGGKGSGRRPSVARVGRHGTVRRYGAGHCRCASCRRAWASYIRERRQRVGARKPRRYYAGPVGIEKAVTLQPLGADILKAVQAREGRTPGEIFEHLLRLHGRDLQFSSEVTAA